MSVPYSSTDPRFAEALLKARLGENGIVQPTFMYLPGIPGGVNLQKSLNGLDYFSAIVELGVSTFLDGADERLMVL